MQRERVTKTIKQWSVLRHFAYLLCFLSPARIPYCSCKQNKRSNLFLR